MRVLQACNVELMHKMCKGQVCHLNWLSKQGKILLNNIHRIFFTSLKKEKSLSTVSDHW